MTQVFFYLMAAIVVGGGLGVVLARNIVHAALFLIMSLLGVAGVYIMLSVEFLALVQILVYGGAVTVLILFALMLTRVRDLQGKLDGDQRPLAAVAAIVLLGAFIAMISQTTWPRDIDQLTVIPFNDIGIFALQPLGGAVRDRVARASRGAGWRRRPVDGRTGARR